jgi:multimeric flavodoxin WrbA
MRALILSCTLKPSPEVSNTEALAQVVIGEFEKAKVETELIRVADLNIPPGTETDMGKGDDWPGVRRKILASDILVIATPTWLGQPSSLVQRVFERMDAMISETKDDGAPVAFNKVGGIVITGNEDGAHHIVGVVAQAMIDVGFTMPAQCWTYWHLGPGPGPDYTETAEGHDWSARTGRTAARNMIAAANALQAHPLPVPEGS